jgi:DNA-binding CsgD family transcriptional regulator
MKKTKMLLKDNTLHEMTNVEIADQLFIHPHTVSKIENRAMEKFKIELKKRNINLKDLIGD